MAILDKLIEKKDVHCYIKARIAFLRKHTEKSILREPPERRELVKQRFSGRIRELELLDQILRRNLMKQKAIDNWKEIER
jgi:chromosomal replication initiation ATPase DnaA